MPYDKKLHILCGLLISLLIGLYNPIYGLSAGVIAGVVKRYMTILIMVCSTNTIC